MFSKLINFDFRAQNVPDWMHNLKNVFEMVIDIVFGGHGDTARAKAWKSDNRDRRHRAECELFGIHESVWLNQEQELPADVRETLMRITDDDVRRATRPALVRWCRALGEDTSSLLVAQLRTKVLQCIQQLRAGTFVYTPKEQTHLPWRLTSAQFVEVDERVDNITFPRCKATVIDQYGICV